MSMNVVVVADANALYAAVADHVIRQIKEKPDSRLGLATGGTYEPVYAHLVAAYKEGKVDFSGVSTVNLDEYYGIAPDHEQSYACSMGKWLFDHVNISPENAYVAKSEGDQGEILRAFRARLAAMQPVDFQLLGVGNNGHIGFNEPGDSLHSGVHFTPLQPDTVKANARFFATADEVPKTAVTMGVGDILGAKRILLAATASKQAPIAALLRDDLVTTSIPVTLLKLHPDVTVIIEQALADEIDRQEK